MDNNDWRAAQRVQIPGQGIGGESMAATASQNMQSQIQNQAQQLPIPMVSNQSQVRQQLLSQIQSQPGQLQQQIDLQMQGTVLQRDMPQRSQASGPLLQQQSTIDQQKQLLQSQSHARSISEEVSDVQLYQIPASTDSSTQMGKPNAEDWQEEIYQKIKSMNEMYFPELNEMCQRMAIKLHQHDALPQHAKNEQHEKLKFFKVMLERLIMFLQTNKNEIQPTDKEKIVGVEKQIVNILSSNRPRKPVSSLHQGQLAQSQMHAMQ